MALRCFAAAPIVNDALKYASQSEASHCGRSARRLAFGAGSVRGEKSTGRFRLMQGYVSIE
jgi:hypothetical protein